MTEDAGGLVIPDTSLGAPPPYRVAVRPPFTPPVDPPLDVPKVVSWNRRAAPDLIFGIPDGWSEVQPEGAAVYQVERDHIPPDAPIRASTRIVAGVERKDAHGLTWSVQLRRYSASGITAVLQDPTNWAKAKSRWAEPLGAPIYRTVAGGRAIALRYAYMNGDAVWVLCETWLEHGGGGYHFVTNGPAEDEAEFWPEWEAMLASSRSEHSAESRAQAVSVAPPAQPMLRYRCNVKTQVPVTLENVTSGQSPMLIVGSPALAAWSMFGVLAARLYGHARASAMEGQTVAVPAAGEAMLMDDRVILRVVADTRAPGVTLRGGAEARSVDLEIPYRTMRTFSADAQGVRLDVIGHGAVWLQPQDRGELAQWLAHLSFNRTWQPLEQLPLQVEAPIVGWCQQDPRYTFGLPANWSQAPAAALADYARAFLPSIVRCAVVLGAGSWEAQVFVIEDGPTSGPSDGETLAAMVLAATNITQVGTAQAATVGGEPAALVRGISWTAEGPFERCYGVLVHAGVRYVVWYGTVGGQIGDGTYESCLSQFHAMLATWHWYA